MLNSELNINKAFEEQVGNILANTFSYTTMTPIKSDKIEHSYSFTSDFYDTEITWFSSYWVQYLLYSVKLCMRWLSVLYVN